MLFTGFYFVLALLVLILVHESGHFLVARWCGVKVLRFSFGFGKILASWYDKRGTEYAWSLFPLGGYVKMLDETEEDVPVSDRHLAFNNQTLLVRVAVVLAGPLFNFLLAFVLLWLVLVIGVKSLAPIIDDVRSDSIVARAGLTAKQEVVAFNGKKIESWRDFQYALLPLIGSRDRVPMTVKSLRDGHQTTLQIPLTNWILDPKKPDALESLGIVPFIPRIPPVVGEILPDSPAASSGIERHDVIVSVENQPVTDWLALVHYVKAHPDEQITLMINRQGQPLQRIVHSGRVIQDGRAEGFLGLSSQPLNLPPNWLRLQRKGPVQALYIALEQTVELTKDTFVMIGRMITGRLSLQNISGPVGIAQGAGESARGGLVYYLSFIALLSISLGVLNVLPIPMLDGGHLFYYLIESIRRHPLSNGLKTKSAYIGLAVIAALTVIALTNDVTRLANAG
ncbi:MAG: RIP metalloprotease RseP [Legionellaceae bacterium]|nr:RIP metalloprotease RseP [Legionellaceae bacterium]